MDYKDSFDIKMIVGYGGFKEGEVENLREQGIDTDDWNFMLFIEDPKGKILDEDENGECDPYEYYISNLLSDRCGNPVWKKKIKFRNKICSVGIEYH